MHTNNWGQNVPGRGPGAKTSQRKECVYWYMKGREREGIVRVDLSTLAELNVSYRTLRRYIKEYESLFDLVIIDKPS